MGDRILRLTEVPSTNRFVMERFRQLPHGLAVVADRQTSGRGRLDRSWHSSTIGNLYVTLVLKVDAAAPELPGAADLPAGFANLAQYMAIVLARVVERMGAPVAVKWPNDLLAGGRKLAGVLAEGASEGGRVLGAALGAGVNLAMESADLAAIDQPATSLNMVLGRRVDSGAFLDDVLTEFFGGYSAFLEAGFRSIRREFLARTPFLGRSISVHSLDSRITGTACDITEEGALVLLTPQGRRELSVGDVQ